MVRHNFDFDPACGYSHEELLAVRPDREAPGFRSFWEKNYEEAMKIRPDISTRKIWSPDPCIEIYEVFFKSLDGVAIGAWLSRPQRSRGALVVGHGYSGSPGPQPHPELTVIQPCIRGFNLSIQSDLPWRGHEHILHGIENRNSYIIRGAVADLWMAASVVLDLFPETADNLNYSGRSFGGGLGALALAWDRRFKSGLLAEPAFGLHRLRLQFKSTGCAESLRLYSHSHPEVINVLKYFDAANAAGHIRMPVVCAPAWFDPAVIPPGQFAVANAIPDDFKTVIPLPAGHYETPENTGVWERINAAANTMFLG